MCQNYLSWVTILVLSYTFLASHGEQPIMDSIEDQLQELYDDPQPMSGRRYDRDDPRKEVAHLQPTHLTPLDPSSFSDPLAKKSSNSRRHKGGAHYTNGKPGKKKSCHTRCHASGSPPCGAWTHSDNSAVANGVYILNSSFVNLTCTVHSLPKPVVIKWVFNPDSGPVQGSKEPVCTSMRTVTDCKFNYLGEHRVRSTCLKRMAKLEDSGTYYCHVVNSGDGEVASAPAKIQVYGIAKLEAIAESINIMFNQTSRLQAAVCANPLPQIAWINQITGGIIRSGQTIGNYTALPLRRLINAHGVYKPAYVQQFCYTAELIISKTTSSERSFTIIATNNVDSKAITLNTRISGLPLKGSGAVAAMKVAQCTSIYAVVTLIVVVVNFSSF